MTLRETPITIRNAAGEALHGSLSIPSRPPRGAALFAHCFTCDSRSHATSRISRALAERGWAVLRFDFTGLGRSEGDFADTTFTTSVDDLRRAAAVLAERFPGPQVLIGHSLGGAAVLAAAGTIPQTAALVTIGTPADPDHVLHLFSDAEPGGENGRLRVNIGGRPFTVGSQLIDDLRRQTPGLVAATLRRPLLVLHAPGDEVVGIENARVIYDRARHPKSFVALDGADHLLTNPADARYVADLVSTWVSRYVAAADGPPDLPDDPVVVREGTADGLLHVASARGTTWLVDEPVDSGGTDLGPTPYEVLLAGLGACTSMTLRMYGRRKGWTFGSTRVELAHDRIHAADCDTCETTSGRIDRITRVIHLDSSLSAEQRDRLMQIADLCPVHRTLTGEIQISTALAPSPTPDSFSH